MAYVYNELNNLEAVLNWNQFLIPIPNHSMTQQMYYSFLSFPHICLNPINKNAEFTFIVAM